MENTVQSISDPVAAPVSEFKGRTIQLIGWRLLGALISVVTLGICMPWAHCMVMRWETNHTYIDGQQLHFDGKGGQLLGRYLLWGLLTVVTIGIYGLFVPVKRRQWRASHTRLATEADQVTKTAHTPNTPDSAPAPDGNGGSLGGIIAGFVVAAVLLLLMGTVLLLKVLPGNPGNKIPLNQGLLQYVFHKSSPDVIPDGPVNGEYYFQFDSDDLPDGIEGNIHIIQNEDGSFTIIHGNSQTAPDHDEQSATDNFGKNPSAPGDIQGSWMRYSENPLGFSVNTYTFHADGTFTTFSDTFDFSPSRGWQASGLSDQNGGGSYRYEDGQLYLYDIYYKIPPNETESGEWELHYTDTSYDWQVTTADSGETLYFQQDGKIVQVNYRFRDSAAEMLDSLYPDGPPHDTI